MYVGTERRGVVASTAVLYAGGPVFQFWQGVRQF